ncbi:MAG TPA: class I SAM-dependent methyltransferase [Chitinophagaceae bacterium]|nr:class I SAM-dependent methyltransferase [Chitinophagaceae bacterium]
MSFKDHFSSNAYNYARFRPGYPKELFSFLASLTNDHLYAWDCGTGNGQAAIELAQYYDKVIATDPSAEQVKNSFPHPKVEYRVEPAEQNTIQSDSLDLLTVSNALHWFNWDVFYKEVPRVLKKDGIIAAWAYATPFVNPEVDKILKHFHDNVIGPFWQHENRLVEYGYKDVPFPFERISAPEFVYEKQMTLDEFIGFLNTWSATQRYILANKINPTDELKSLLSNVWDGAEKKVNWNLILRVGRV